MCKNYNELWNLSFEIESILLNLMSKDSETKSRAMSILDDKVEKFNSIYAEIKSINNSSADDAIRSIGDEVVCDAEDSAKNDNLVADIENSEIETPLKVENPCIEAKLEESAIITAEKQCDAKDYMPEEEISRRLKPLTNYFTLNDKFLFARELFGGSVEQYIQALSLIESMPDYETAEDYFINDLGWDADNAEVKLFQDIVKRYFSE